MVVLLSSANCPASDCPAITSDPFASTRAYGPAGRSTFKPPIVPTAVPPVLKLKLKVVPLPKLTPSTPLGPLTTVKDPVPANPPALSRNCPCPDTWITCTDPAFSSSLLMFATTVVCCPVPVPDRWNVNVPSITCPAAVRLPITCSDTLGLPPENRSSEATCSVVVPAQEKFAPAMVPVTGRLAVRLPKGLRLANCPTEDA